MPRTMFCRSELAVRQIRDKASREADRQAIREAKPTGEKRNFRQSRRRRGASVIASFLPTSADPSWMKACAGHCPGFDAVSKFWGPTNSSPRVSGDVGAND